MADSARRCKKFGQGRGAGSHHTRRDRIADPKKATEAQTKRAARRTKAKRIKKTPGAQSHVKTLAQIAGGRPEIDRSFTAVGIAPERDRDFVIVGVAEARPKMEPGMQFPNRTLRRPGMELPRVALIGDNTTTVADSLHLTKLAETSAVIHDGEDVLAAPKVTDADRDAAITVITADLDEKVAALLALPIEELELPVRSYNIVKREGIDTIGDLVGKTEAELLDYSGMGQGLIDKQIKTRLAAQEPPLSLKSDTPNAG